MTNRKHEYIFPPTTNNIAPSVKSPELESMVAGTSEKVNALTQAPALNSEEMNEALYEKLNALWDGLRPALDAYLTMFNEEFGNEEFSYINIEMPFPGAPVLTVDNIEIGSIFSDFNPESQEDIALYEGLLQRLKQNQNPVVQAHLLGYIDLLNVYVASKVEEGSSKHDSSKIFETDEFLNIVFGNPKLNPSYKKLLKRVFDLMDTDTGLMAASSIKLHSKHGKILDAGERDAAIVISRLFE